MMYDVVTSGRIMGAADLEDDGAPFEKKMARLTAELEAQFEKSARLERVIRENLESLGYDD